MLLDGIQILLCVLILFYLVRNRLKTNRAARANRGRTDLPDFTRVLLLEAARQQVEDALDAVVRRVEDERLRLQDVLTEPGLQPQPGMREAAPPVHGRPDESTACLAAPNAELRPYGAIAGLSVGGLGSRQIAETLKLPVGEVELVLQLQRAASRAVM
jgi:hypothetical protein